MKFSTAYSVIVSCIIMLATPCFAMTSRIEPLPSDIASCLDDMLKPSQSYHNADSSTSLRCTEQDAIMLEPGVCYTRLDVPGTDAVYDASSAYLVTRTIGHFANLLHVMRTSELLNTDATPTTIYTVAEEPSSRISFLGRNLSFHRILQKPSQPFHRVVAWQTHRAKTQVITHTESGEMVEFSLLGSHPLVAPDCSSIATEYEGRSFVVNTADLIIDTHS